jgi:hypothetical protein
VSEPNPQSPRTKAGLRSGGKLSSNSTRPGRLGRPGFSGLYDTTAPCCLPYSGLIVVIRLTLICSYLETSCIWRNMVLHPMGEWQIYTFPA